MKLPGRKPRALLLLLLLNRNTVVPAERIMDHLWAGAPPASGPNLVHVYIWQIRRALDELGESDRVGTEGAGYRLRVLPGEVDVDIFESLTHQAREALASTKPYLAASLLDEALDLWHGSPLSDVAYEDFAQAEVARLEELRLNAMEIRFSAKLALGQHQSLIPGLQALVSQHPLREGLRAQLMLSLARSNRLAEALRVARDGRRAIQAEFGVEPGADFQELEEALLIGRSEMLTLNTGIQRQPVVSQDSATMTFMLVDIPVEPSSAILDVIREAGGRFVDTESRRRVGVMPGPAAALDAALRIASLGEASTEARIAAHTGPVVQSNSGFAGPGLDRALALLAAARPGQTLLSGSLVDQLASADLQGIRLIGTQRLTDLAGPEPLFTLDGYGSTSSTSNSLHVVPNNLPDQTTTFVGREHDLAVLTEAISAQRLVTLSGPPGIGKTRLAIHAAARSSSETPDGVWLINLVPADRPDTVAEAVMRVLGLSDQAGRTPLEVLAEYLHDRSCLLILDNCEHVVAAAAEVATDLLSDCESVRILATGRAPLDAKNETVIPVAHLSIGENGVPTRASAAVRLFADRAAAARPGFRITEETAGPVVEVCRELAGIPLALELAASRLSTVNLDELRQALTSTATRQESQDEPADRHRTIDAALDWSHRLLTEDEKSCLRAVSLFDGPFSAASARTVLETMRREEVDSALETLENHSLIVFVETSGRYRMLEPIRQYARRRLEDHIDASDVRARYIEWCVMTADEAYQGLRDHRQPEWLRTLDLEIDNLTAGLRLADAIDPKSLSRIVGGLWYYWYLRGRLTEARLWLDPAITVDVAAETRVSALQGMGVVALNQGDNGQARAACQESYHICLQAGDLAGAAISRNCEGLIDRYEGAFAQASQAHTEALELARHSDAPLETGVSLIFLGLVEYYQGDHDRAVELATESWRIFRKIGWPWGMCLCVTFLGLGHLGRGNISQASNHLQDGLVAARSIGHPSLIAESLEGLAAIAGRQGQTARQARLLEQALREHERIREVWRVAECLEEVAQLAALSSAELEAATLIGAATEYRRQISFPLTPAGQKAHADLMSRLTDQLDSDLLEAAITDGGSLPVPQALTRAIHLTSRLGKIGHPPDEADPSTAEESQSPADPPQTGSDETLTSPAASGRHR